MSKIGSLKYQVFQKIDSLKRFGESKHEAKKREKERCKKLGIKWNPSKVEGIYSWSTCDNYKRECLKFVEWVQQNYVKEHKIKYLDKIQYDVVRRYLQQNIDSNKSPYTVHLMASAIAKVLDCSPMDFNITLPPRKIENITRSRLDREHDKHVSIENNKDIIEFCKGTGLRRRELISLNPNCIFEKNNHVYVEIKEGSKGGAKGGKPRVFKVIESHKEHILNMRNKAIDEGKNRVFTKVINRLDVHSYRRVYATNRYMEFKNMGEGSGEFYTRRMDKKKIDRGIAVLVSNELGHNRLDVVCRHYL